MERVAEWHLKAELSEARRVRELLGTVLKRSKVDNPDPFLLACSELIVNLSRYPNPKPTEVILTFSKDDHDWWLELRDNGPSFNNFSQLINNPDPLQAAESGMGLKLLDQMFTSIRYVPACYREDSCNLMLLKQPINSSSQVKRSLLVVDDDPAYRSVISAYLKFDYKVIEAETVQRAFGQILTHQPDLVICDIKMPDQDGTVLFDQISHIPEVSDTAFIYLSGCQDPELIGLALSRPIDDYLEKPVSRDELILCVERVIKRRGYLNKQIRHEYEQKLTLGLQPYLPEQIPGYQIQLRTLNPEPGGGDLVQLQRSEEHSLILMADLMGHGLAAKGYSYALAGYLKGLSSAAYRQNIDLTNLFKLLSEGFNEDDLLKSTLATLLAVRFSSDGYMDCVNAGQPYPILIDDHEINELQVNGPLPGLGVENYELVRHKLNPGQRVLLYSDGFIDAGKAITPEIKNAMVESSSMPLSAAADFLLSAKLNTCRVLDDLTLVLIEKD